MVEVEVLESGLVTPAETTPKHRLWLSNLDLLVARAHTPTVYFYRSSNPPQAGDFFSPDALKTALPRALVAFYPLAGRLAVSPDGRLEIDCNAEGALFVVARSESAVDELGDLAPSDEMRRLMVPSAASGNPPCILLMFQLTFFNCGGVCLGAAVHHTAVDGLGALDFINYWSDIARGVSNPPFRPFLDRTPLRARSPPAVIFDHIEYAPKPSSESAKTPFDIAILKLSKAQLDCLMTSTASGKKPLSSFKAVVAHVWRAACKARKLRADQQTRLYMTADARKRIAPPLPDGYLGNAIFRTLAAATAGEIISNSLEFGASRVHEATNRLTDEHVRSLIDFLEMQEDVRGLTKGSWAMPATDLWVISWQGLPIYDADFGWGRPEFMCRACLQFAGLVYIVPSSGGDGALSVVVALEHESMMQFKEIFYDDLEVSEKSSCRTEGLKDLDAPVAH